MEHLVVELNIGSRPTIVALKAYLATLTLTTITGAAVLLTAQPAPTVMGDRRVRTVRHDILGLTVVGSATNVAAAQRRTGAVTRVRLH